MLSKINLVDLAGSERSKKTGVAGQTLTEASYINKSLTFLEQVVQALVKGAPHVPYRQSKLTAVLRDALGGNNKAAMVANVWPEGSHVEETLATLRFASRVRLLENDAVVNESSDPSFVIKKQERIIRELKQELAMRDTLAGRGVVSYDDLSDADVADLQALVKRFLDGDAEESELPTDTLKRIKEVYRQFRNVHMTVKGQLESRVLQAQKTARPGELERMQSGGGEEGADALVSAADKGLCLVLSYVCRMALVHKGWEEQFYGGFDRGLGMPSLGPKMPACLADTVASVLLNRVSLESSKADVSSGTRVVVLSEGLIGLV